MGESFCVKHVCVWHMERKKVVGIVEAPKNSMAEGQLLV